MKARKLSRTLGTASALVLVLALALAGSSATRADDGTTGSSETGAATQGNEETRPGKVDPATASIYYPMAAPLKWYSVAGAFFFPSGSGYTYSYPGVGCIHSATSGQWRAGINLPDGSVVKAMYINYYNGTTSGNSRLWFTRYHWSGTFNDIGLVDSRTGASTGAGYFYDVNNSIAALNTIDNLNYAYVFVWSGSTTQNLCQVQVGYIPPPIFGSALPMILR